MELNIQIPAHKADIFDHLQKGLFINSNSCDENIRPMYDERDDHLERLPL